MQIHNIHKIIPLFLNACLTRILRRSDTQAALTSGFGACNRNVSFNFLLRNQISNLVGLSPICSVIPKSVV